MKGPPRYLTALVAENLVAVGSSPLAQYKLTLLARALQVLAALVAQAAQTALTALVAVVAQAGRLVWPALEALEGQAVLVALTALQVAAALVAQAALEALEGRGLHLPAPYLAAVGLCPCPPVVRPCLAQLPLGVALLPVVGPLLGVARRLAAQQQHPLSQQQLLQRREPNRFSKPPTGQSTKLQSRETNSWMYALMAAGAAR